MYNVSEAYKAAVYTTPIYSRLDGSINLSDGRKVPIYDNRLISNVVKDSVSINNKAVSKNKLEYGCAYVGELNIALYNDIDRNALYGATITLSWGLKLASGVYEEVPMGEFIISEAVRTKRIVKIKAYDKMQLLDMEFLSTETSGSVYAVLSYISSITGVQLAQTEDEIEALTNGSRYVVIAENMGYTTYRDIISDIAAMLCCFATMTRDGKLKFVPFRPQIAEIITASMRNNSQIAEKVINYDALRMQVKKSIYTTVKTGSEIGTSVYDMDTVPIIGQNHAVAYIQTTLQNMVDEISALSYTPCSFEMVGNPALDLGDYVQLVTDDATECYAPIMAYNWKYHGNMQIKAVGESTTQGQSKTSKVAADIADAVASNETVIYTYENARSYTINADYKQIIRLDFVSRQATKGLFHAQILVTASADAQIGIKYVFNNSADIYFQPVETVTAGRHMITLFYPLIAIPQNTANSLRVQMMVTAGTVEIEAFNIKAAVTAQGLDTGRVEWDGTIEIEEEFTDINLAGISVKPLAENVTKELTAYTSGSITQSFSRISLAGISIRGFTEQIGSGEGGSGQQSGLPEFVIDRAIVGFESQNNYIMIENGRTKLRSVYTYESEIVPINSGSLCSVVVVTNDKASIEGIGLENGEL